LANIAAIEALIDTHAQASVSLFAAWFASPVGPLLCICDDQGVHLLGFGDSRGLVKEVARLRSKFGAIAFGDTPILQATKSQLSAYFAGKSHDFTLKIAHRGTPFQNRAWAALMDIPYGQTRSYGQQALALNQPTATRAVAAANGANPLAIIVPCHRVIGSDGKLTGYGGKLWRKRWLLAHEQQAVTPDLFAFAGDRMS
jgi:AraC family transcriptional regulator of adaptative response/methylated-DNA-[protein]-cysteine methyltransferase